MPNVKLTKEKQSVAALYLFIFFSEKMNTTRWDAEAEDNKDSKGWIDQQDEKATLHPTLLFQKCPYTEWQQTRGASRGQKWETLSHT